MSQRFRTHTAARRHTDGGAIVRRRNFLTRPLGLECLEDRRLLAAFQADSVVVYRVGDGVTALGTAAAAIYLDEFSPSGVLRQSLPLPDSTISAAGNQISEGFLSRSTDGRYLIVPGYNASVGTASVSGTASTIVPRMLGRVSGAGAFQVAGASTQWFSNNSIRSAASPDGNTLYAAGAGNSGGVWMIQFGDGTATRINSTATTARNVAIFGNQLYASTMASTRLGKVGSGLPVDANQTFAQLNTLPGSTGAHGYFFADLDVAVAGDDTLYITDDPGGKVTKYSFINETWTDKGSVTFGAGVRGLTGSVSEGAVTLYATSSNGTLSELRTLTDSSGFEGTFAGSTTLLANVISTSMAFRGVALAPQVPNASPVYDVDGETALTTQAQDATNNTGDTITTLIASAGTGRITDADSLALQGLAIVAADTTGGAWQYSLDGSTWLPLGAVSDASARLLPADGVARIRFVPNGVDSGAKAAALQVRAWDGTQGLAGDLLDTAGKTGSGGSLSTAVEDVSLRINQTPTLTPIADQTIDEDGATAALEFTIGDDDALSLLVLTVASSNPDLLPVDHIAITGSGATRTLVAMPLANAFGDTTITLQISDGQSTSQRSFLLTVRSVNDLPTIATLTPQRIDEDSSLVELALLVGDVEDGGAVTVTASSSDPLLVAADGLVFGGDGANRTLTIHPLANAFGAATITLLVTDSNGGTASTSFVLTVDAVNDAPVIATIGNQQTDEDQPLQGIALDVFDVETASDQLQVTAVSDDDQLFPAGSLTIVYVGGIYQLNATPAANLFGAATITVSVTDSAGASRSTSFTLTVSPINDPPTLQPIVAQTIDEDGAIGPLALSVDDIETPSELTLTAATDNDLLFPPAGVSLALVDNVWRLTLTPAANQSGTATVTVTVFDPSGASHTQTFLATVQPNDDPPTIAAIANQSTEEDTPLAGIALDLTDIDTPTADLILSASSSDDALFPVGSLTFVEINGVRTLRLAPAVNLSGSASITVTVADPAGGSSSTTFTIVVAAVNDPPTLAAISNQTIDEDAPFGPLVLPVADVESLAQSSIVATADDEQLFAPGGIVASFVNGQWQLSAQPASNLSGTTQVTLLVTDPAGATATQSFLLAVNAINDLPTIATIADQTTDEDTPLEGVAIEIADIETAIADLSLTVATTNELLFPAGSLTVVSVNGSPTLRLAPAGNRSGAALITVTVTDALGASSSSSFTVTVAPQNDQPTIAAIVDQQTEEEVPLTGIVINASDAETAAAELVVTASSNDSLLFPTGSLTVGIVNGVHLLQLTPAADRFGSAVVTVLVSDGSKSVSTTFTIVVTPVNDRPTLAPIDSQTMTEDGALGPLALMIDDLESPTQLIVTAESSNPLLVPSDQIAIVYVNNVWQLSVSPTANLSGDATITVHVRDPEGATATQQFVLTVDPRNDLPTIGAIAAQTLAEDTTLELPIDVADQETSRSALRITATAGDDALFPAGAIAATTDASGNQLRLTPAANRFGSTVVTVTVTDEAGATATTSFSVVVSPVDDPLEVQNITLQVVQATPTTGQLAASDADGPPLRFSIGSLPRRGTVTITDFSTGAFVYRPRPLALGFDSFIYFVSDGITTQQALVTIDIERPMVDVQYANGVLTIAGSAGRDTIIVAPAEGRTVVLANGRISGPFATPASIDVTSTSDADQIFIHANAAQTPTFGDTPTDDSDGEAEQHLPASEPAAHDMALLDLLSFWNAPTAARRRAVFAV